MLTRCRDRAREGRVLCALAARWLACARPLGVWLALGAWCPAALAQAAPDPAEDGQSGPQAPFSYGVEIGFRSGHADRGFLISDRPVLQPVTWVSRAGASFSAWSNVPLTRTTSGELPQIVELELSRPLQWGSLTLEPAGRMFFYRDPVSPYSTRSVEGWLYLSYGAGPVSLFSNQSFDVLTYRGAYFGDVGLESEWHMSRSIEAGGSLGFGWASPQFNDEWAGVHRWALNRVVVEGWMTAQVQPRLYVGPYLELSAILDRRIRAELTHPTYLLVGLTTGVEF